MPLDPPNLIRCALLGVLASGVCAQQDHNPVERNNDPWLVTSTTQHTNGNYYLFAPNNPAAFSNPSSAVGVPAGSLTFRWIPGDQNNRQESRAVSGFLIGLAPSAATVSFPIAGYIPEFKIHVPKPQGAGFVPDLAQAALMTVPKSSWPVNSAGYYVVTSTLATPITVTQREIVMSWRWEGGEHDNTPGKQGLFGSYSDGVFTPVTYGFADPSSAITMTSSDFSVLWGSYLEEQAVICAQSDYGYRRDASLLPQVSGYSIGTGQADLATQACKLGWDVFAGASRAGHYALPLLNVSPVIFPGSFIVAGQTIELNIGDGALSVLASAGYLLTLDAKGFGNGPLLPIPALSSSALGVAIGVEFAIIDAALTQVVESTAATWIRINR